MSRITPEEVRHVETKAYATLPPSLKAWLRRLAAQMEDDVDRIAGLRREVTAQMELGVRYLAEADELRAEFAAKVKEYEEALEFEKGEVKDNERLRRWMNYILSWRPEPTQTPFFLANEIKQLARP